MMNMIDTTGPSFSFLFFPLHALTCLAIGIGIVFLIVWAMKTLTPSQLKKWGLGLLIGGVVACILTCLLVYPVHKTAYRDISKMDTMHREMMNNMMDSDEGDMMNMSMDGMADMLEGKTGDAFDQAFIKGMIPHHQGAIDMAIAARQSAKHDEIKRMADDIISAQQREIDMMKQWMSDWGYNQ